MKMLQIFQLPHNDYFRSYSYVRVFWYIVWYFVWFGHFCVISNFISKWNFMKNLIFIWFRLMSLEVDFYSFGGNEIECFFRIFLLVKFLLISDFVSKRIWSSWNRYCLVLYWEVQFSMQMNHLQTFLAFINVDVIENWIKSQITLALRSRALRHTTQIPEPKFKWYLKLYKLNWEQMVD